MGDERPDVRAYGADSHGHLRWVWGGVGDVTLLITDYEEQIQLMVDLRRGIDSLAAHPLRVEFLLDPLNEEIGWLSLEE